MSGTVPACSRVSENQHVNLIVNLWEYLPPPPPRGIFWYMQSTPAVMVDTKPDGIIQGFVNELQFPAIHCMVQIHPGLSSLVTCHPSRCYNTVYSLLMRVLCVHNAKEAKREGRIRKARGDTHLLRCLSLATAFLINSWIINTQTQKEPLTSV